MSSLSLQRFTMSPLILVLSGTLLLALGIVNTKKKKSKGKRSAVLTN